MGDPFSVATSAVGVVSLGLTVCQGLITYWSQAKSFKRETNDVADKVSGLKDLLEALHDVLSDTTTFDASSISGKAKIAVRLVEQCDQGVQRLEKMLEKVRRSEGLLYSKSEKAKQHLDRALYPFRRDELTSFVNTIDGLRANLHMALELLDMLV
jgi:hypothetical protein